MHIADLAPFDEPPYSSANQLIAVGWLEPTHPYSIGDVNDRFIRKLMELLVNPWEPAVTMGRHCCGFCRLSGGPSTFQLPRGVQTPAVQMGTANVWVPADGRIFVAPSLVLHYIDAHGYAPAS